MSTGEIACTYAASILHDDGIPVTAEKIETIESYWPPLFAKLCENRNIDDLITNVGSIGGAAVAATTAPEGADSGAAAAPASEEKKKEEKEDESEEDMGFSLFD